MRTSTIRKLITSGIAATILTGATAGVALAHDRGEQRFERLADKLELTEEQQSELKALFDERRDAMQERHEERKDRGDKPMGLGALDPTSDSFSADVEKLIADTQARIADRIHEQAEMKQKVSEILTPEQFEEWQKMAPKGGDHGDRGRPGPGKHHDRGERGDRDCR